MATPKIDLHRVDEYAEWLVRVLSQDLSVLSGSGLPLKYELRTPLTIEHCDESSKRRWGPLAWNDAYDPIHAFPREEPRTLEADLLALDRWRRTPPTLRQPLLIVGPFGSGKSSLLAWLAVTMALELREAIKSGSADGVLIPFPVRLREIRRWERSSKRDKRFVTFMHESQYSLDPNSRRGHLDQALIEELLDCQQLVPLFDGLDELPDTERAEHSSRRKTLHAIRTTCGMNYAITSRPCYEVDCLIDDAKRVALRPLTQEVVAQTLEKRLSTSDDAIRIAKSALAIHGPHAASLLTRPLFLAAWLRVIPQDGSKPPSGIDGLMTEVVLHCFDGRSPEGALPSEELDEVLTDLGGILAVFIDHEMHNSLDESAFFRLCPSDLGSRPESTRKRITLAITAGFLSPVGQRSWAIQRMPAVDFLVGRFLAASVQRGSACPRAIIEYFQKWAARQHLHDILDFAFSMLWNGDDRQQYWAANLVSWAIESGRATDSGDAPTENAGADLVHSLAAAALRWCVLDYEKSGSEVLRMEAITETARSLTVAHSHGVMGYFPLASLSLDRNDTLAICKAFVQEHAGCGHDHSRTWWEAAAKCVREDEVSALIPMLIETQPQVEVATPEWDEDSWQWEAWECIVSAAASRVCAKDAISLVETAFENRHANYLWEEVAVGAARRIPSESAAQLVEACIEHCTSTADRYDQNVFGRVSEEAAKRLPEATAGVIIKRWLAKYDQASIASTRHRWSNVILSATGRVSKADAPAVLSDLRTRAKTKDVSESLHWESAAHRAAKKLPSDSADLLIAAMWQDGVLKCPWADRETIEGAISAISDETAIRLIQELRKLGGPFNNGETWVGNWVRRAGYRVAPADALALLSDLAEKLQAMSWSDSDFSSFSKRWYWAEALKGPISVMHGNDLTKALNVILGLRRAAIALNQSEDGMGYVEYTENLLAYICVRIPREFELDACMLLLSEGATDAAMQAASVGMRVAIARTNSPAGDRVVDLAGLPVDAYLACPVAGMRLPISVASEAIREAMKEASAEVPDDASHRPNNDKRTGAVTTDSDADFVFRRGPARTWIIAFNGDMHTIGGNQKGLEYIARLIEQPNRRLSPFELTLTGEASALRAQADRDRPVELLDADAIRSVKKRLSDLRCILESREDAAAEQELRQLRKILRQSARPGGKQAAIRDSAIKKAATNVQNAITRAMSHLEANGLEELVRHLRECGCGRMDDYHFVYRNSSPPKWDVSWLEPVPKG